MEVAIGADVEAGPTAISKPTAARVAAGPAAAAKEAPDEAMSKHRAKGVESQTQSQRSSRSTAAFVPTRTRAYCNKV